MYKHNPALRGAVSRIAVSVAQVKWHVLVSGEERKSHPLSLLMAKPNENFTLSTIIELTQICLDIVGECFWIVTKNDSGTPVMIDFMPPQELRRRPDSGQNYYLFGGIAGNEVKISPENVIWIRTPDIMNPIGKASGTAEALTDEIDIDEAASQYIMATLVNQAMPHAVIHLKGLGKEQTERFRQNWEERNRGPNRAGRTHVVSTPENTDIEVKRFDSPFNELRLIEMREAEDRRIRETYAIPPEIMGHNVGGTRGTIYSAREIFADNIVQPRLERIRGELMSKLVPMFRDSNRLNLTFDDPKPINNDFRLEAMKANPQTVTINEWRAIQGLEPITDGDKLFQPSFMNQSSTKS